MIIYKAINKVNGKHYIGQTTRSFEQRVRQHINDHTKRDYKFYLAMRKYGVDSFEWSIICECDSIEELNVMESHYINEHNSIKNGYNCVDREQNIISDELKEKMRERMLGEGNPMYGKTHTEETRKKISDANKGKTVVHSEETKQKMRERMTGKNNWNYGNSTPEEVKRKISESTSGENNHFYGKKHDEGTKQKMRKKYIVTTPDGEEVKVDNLSLFCEENNLNYYCMSGVARGQSKQHKGYICRKVDNNRGGF